jgi:hypothetical protein
MGAKVVITFQGLEETISRLDAIEEKAGQNLQTQTERLAKDSEQVWQQNTHRRSGRMQSEERAVPARLSFTLNNTTRYYEWVDKGHMTPRGWRTRRGYRLAKRRRRVEGQHMTEKAVQFIEQNATQYLSKFLDNV